MKRRHVVTSRQWAGVWALLAVGVLAAMPATAWADCSITAGETLHARVTLSAVNVPDGQYQFDFVKTYDPRQPGTFIYGPFNVTISGGTGVTTWPNHGGASNPSTGATGGHFQKSGAPGGYTVTGVWEWTWNFNGGQGGGPAITCDVTAVIQGPNKSATYVLNWDNATCPQEESVTLVVNGVTVSTVSMGPSSTGQGQFTDSDAAAGDTWAWMIDGATIESGTVIFSAEFPNAYSAISDFTNTCPPPPPTPTPTPTPTPEPTPTPSATPAPLPTIPPNPSPNPTLPPAPSPGTGGPGGEITGNVTVENPNDFYEPMRRAVEDAGGTQPLPGPNAPDHETNDFSDRGKLDELQGKVDQAATAITDAKTVGVEKIQGLTAAWSSMPTSFGSVTALPFNMDLISNAATVGFSLPTSLDLTPMMPGINLMRELLKWGIRIAFLTLTVRAFSYQH